MFGLDWQNLVRLNAENVMVNDDGIQDVELVEIVHDDGNQIDDWGENPVIVHADANQIDETAENQEIIHADANLIDETAENRKIVHDDTNHHDDSTENRELVQNPGSKGGELIIIHENQEIVHVSVNQIHKSSGNQNNADPSIESANLFSSTLFSPAISGNFYSPELSNVS